MFRRLLVVLCSLLVLASAGDALARSGGSMGGGFRSRSSSSSFSRSFSRSSPSTSFRPSPTPSYSSGTRYVPIPIPIGGGYGYGRSYGYSSGSSSGGLIFFVILLAIVGVIVVITVVRSRKQAAQADKASRVDVLRIQLGVQAQARNIQERFEKMADSADTDSEAGLARLLREVALALRQQVEAIEYGALTRAAALALPAAQQQFGQWSTDARSKYNREIVRADDMGLRKTQKEAATKDALHDEDGEFAIAEFFVVSLVFALRGVDIAASVNDARELEALLERLARVTADELVAVEVVWSPASLSDSLAKDDMLLRYPELFAI